jgi:hypothetical protein
MPLVNSFCTFTWISPRAKRLTKALGAIPIQVCGDSYIRRPLVGSRFKWERGFQPDGIPSLDMNLFQDPLDSKAYLIRDCAHQYVGISELSADYLNTTGVINKIDGCEVGTMYSHIHCTHTYPRTNSHAMYSHSLLPCRAWR